jgi:hypothetical protein
MRPIANTVPLSDGRFRVARLILVERPEWWNLWIRAYPCSVAIRSFQVTASGPYRDSLVSAGFENLPDLLGHLQTLRNAEDQ